MNEKEKGKVEVDEEGRQRVQGKDTKGKEIG